MCFSKYPTIPRTTTPCSDPSTRDDLLPASYSIEQTVFCTPIPCKFARMVFKEMKQHLENDFFLCLVKASKIVIMGNMKQELREIVFLIQSQANQGRKIVSESLGREEADRIPTRIPYIFDRQRLDRFRTQNAIVICAFGTVSRVREMNRPRHIRKSICNKATNVDVYHRCFVPFPGKHPISRPPIFGLLCQRYMCIGKDF